MSGGYQIGPDGVLVRPAEHAASTYTKPELPEEAKENTERGAELAAEYLLDTLTYAWNTGDTQPFEDITQPGEKFREGHIKNVNALYANGWMYGNKTTVTNIVSVLPASEKEWGLNLILSQLYSMAPQTTESHALDKRSSIRIPTSQSRTRSS